MGHRPAVFTATLVGTFALVVALSYAAIQASIECSPSCTVRPGTTVTLTAAVTSSAPIRNLEWDLDGDGLFGAADEPDEPNGPSATSVERHFTGEGTFEVGLVVTNGEAETARATKTVTVATPPPDPPPPPGPPPPPDPPPPIAPSDPPPGAAGVAALTPPLPSGDQDGDRVPNGDDLCPATSPETRAIGRGCSLIDVIVSPALLLEWAGTSVGAADRELRSLAGLRRPLRRLKAAVSRLRLAGRQLAADPCRGSRAAAGAVESAATGLRHISKIVRVRQRSLVVQLGRLAPSRRGDTGALEARFDALAFKREQAGDAVADVRRVARLFATACRKKVGKRDRTVQARVAKLDAGSSVAKLSDGTTLALGAAKGVSGIAPGVAVKATGTLLEGRVLVAEKVAAKGLNLTAKQLPCTLIPKIAPVQDFTLSFTDLLYYDRRGYLEGNKYVLEGGMGINASRSGDCTHYDDYRLHISLDYRDAAGTQVVGKPIGWVRGFSGSDPPVLLPPDIHPDTQLNKNAKLTFSLWGYDCTDATLTYCAGVQLLDKDPAPAELRAKGRWGPAVYDRKRYSVEDGSKTDFDVATLLGANIPPVTLPSPTVFGVGYGISGGQSTYPNAQYILENQAFAVHDDVPAATAADYQDDKVGIPGGLKWAYITGQRNGHPYHYVAELPNIVTDVVGFCPSLPDAFYRLPWAAGTSEKVTQGNFGDLTHNDDPATPGADQAFAFDFRMSILDKGFAPRGGLVEMVEEKLTDNSNPNAVKYWKELTDGKLDLYKPANRLRIRHQDRTVSTHAHMPKNGVEPKEGDIVERGDWVIRVGNTGNSTGPHLHYHVMNPQQSETIQIRFEVANYFAPTVPVPCVTPDENVWFSTNAKPSS